MSYPCIELVVREILGKVKVRKANLVRLLANSCVVDNHSLWNPSKKVQVHQHIIRTRKIKVKAFLDMQNDL
jgi:hypothetical protein